MNAIRCRRLAGLLALVALVVLPQGLLAQTGSADFTRYVAVGDSLTAGVWSGGFARKYQSNSYPALIARQARGAGTTFEQPLVSDPGLPPVFELQSLVPLRIVPKTGQGQPLNLNLPRPYDNMAVPGANARDVVATLNGGLHDLILRNTPQRVLGTQLQQAAFLRPTFATVWVGNNDVLAAATAGRVIEGVTLTPAAAFEQDFRTLVNTLTAVGARLAIANIPDVTAIAFVNAVPGVVINPQTQQPVLINGQPVPLIGPNGPVGPNDRVLITALAELAQGRGVPAQLGGSGQPLSDGAVLDAGEIATIRARTTALNNIIRTVANEKNAALVDAHSFFNRFAAEGLHVAGVTYTTAFLTGGLFSYDGVHPTAFGYAVAANLFLEAINDKFDADIPLVDLAPFVFGTATAGATAPGSAAAGSAVAAFYFTPEAWANLRWLLNVPSNAEIDAASPKPRKPRRRGNRG